MDARIFARSVLLVTEKNMRIYYYKGAVVIFGLLFPFIMFLTFFIGRNLNLLLFFPAFLGMMLFFSSSSTGPLITPWEKREWLRNSPALSRRASRPFLWRAASARGWSLPWRSGTLICSRWSCPACLANSTYPTFCVSTVPAFCA